MQIMVLVLAMQVLVVISVLRALRPITNTVKNAILATNPMADPIISTPLVLRQRFYYHFYFS